jgi:SMC interacting uncharacterized protein involved in chromosome segregation
VNAKLKKVLLIGIISIILLSASFVSGCFFIYRKMGNIKNENIQLKRDVDSANDTIRKLTENQERERDNYRKLEFEYSEFKKRYSGEGIIIGTIKNGNAECIQLIREIDEILSEAEAIK